MALISDAQPDFLRSLPNSPQQQHLRKIHLDPALLLILLAIAGYGLVVLFSALDGDTETLTQQAIRLMLAFMALFVAAQLDPRFCLRWAPWLYLGGVVLLALVLLVGIEAKGSRRWLGVPGLPRFQPSELMKIGVPLMLGWYFHDRRLPPRFHEVLIALAIAFVPAGLVVMQPDLGTGLLIAAGGMAVILLAGLAWRWMLLAAALAAAVAPVMWNYMHEYQQQRVLTLFDPERDPLGAGWNIIQSKTAIGSGGLFGKGLFQGTQSRLEFLPESTTDFIIAVIGEELGLAGVSLLLVAYLAVIARGLWIATQAPDTFSRLVVGGLTLSFFVYVFVNIAMVSGILPVVGVPLPLVSYGGTSAITLLAGFGIVMSIHTHRKWVR